MTVSREAIMYAIENSFFEVLMPSKYGETLVFSGLRGRQLFEGTHPFFDLVGAAQFSRDNADTQIDRVVAHFVNQKKTFGWMVGPLSTPDDLAARLEHKGLKRIVEQAGMVLYDLNCEIKTNSKITVRKATEADADDLAYVYEHGFPIPREFAFVLDVSLPPLNGANYLAFLEGVEKPISAASMFKMPGHPILALQGAATLGEYRGKGSYTALVAKRLADGRAQGLEAAILQANRHTSGPICAKLGFEEVCSIDIWGLGMDEGAY